MTRSSHQHPRPASRAVRAAVALAATLALGLVAGCSSGGGSDAGGSSSGDVAASDSLAALDGPREAAQPASAGRAGSPELQQRKVISTGELVLRADDVARARDAARRVAGQHGGEITEEQTDRDDDGEAVTAHLVLRVPAARFADAMHALSEVAEERYSTSHSKDVTTRVIDTRTRLRTQRRSVARVQELLARAQDLRDIVLIEAQLSRRQAALESLEQQAAYLADQTARSTITVDLEHEHAAAGPGTDHTGFLPGLSAGWHGLVTVAVGLATAVGALLPFAGVLLVLALVAWPALRVVRRRRGPAV